MVNTEILAFYSNKYFLEKDSIRKVLMGLFWASKYCSDVDFVLKVNDDVWVNAPRFLDYFESNVHQNHFFGGKCVMGQPDRNRNSPSKSSIIKFC